MVTMNIVTMIFYWLQRYGLTILSEKGDCMIGMLVHISVKK